MTTLQPRLVRADTLDLQSHNAPSAQDHTRSPTFAPYAHGTTAPHHREALRNAEESAYNDRQHSPRMNGSNTGPASFQNAHQYDSTDDDGDDEQQEETQGISSHDAEYEDGNAENDDDLEDDMLDKISSSPSIEDGRHLSKAASEFLRYDNQPRQANPIFESQDQTNALLSRSMALAQVYHGADGFLTSQEQSASLTLLTNNVTRCNDVADDASIDDEDQDWTDEGSPWSSDASSSDDDPDDFNFCDDARFVVFGWGGECLRETEDIDFEFVYALHTFVATVEGQANATKGDTMVLLDDNNSYWWLVRVVKDGSIGYLPAEHIETPTERLARLNKHRNIDLSASMLGDNPEKSKNPLKKAMKRRNAKSVAFAAPTYYEPSEYEYDTDDMDEDESVDGTTIVGTDDGTQSEAQDVHERPQPTQEQESVVVVVNGVKKGHNDDQQSLDSPISPVRPDSLDAPTVQVQPDENMQRVRNGVVRNTDSFFKDDSVETRKISLTPQLLRNDVDPNSANNQDLNSKASTDTFDKLLGSEDRSKEKKKEKKGMLSGLFKRKDKSGKGSKSDTEDERTNDSTRQHVNKDTSEPVSNANGPDRKPSKLQKNQQNTINSPKDSISDAKFAPQVATNKSPSHSPKSSESLPSSTIARDLTADAQKEQKEQRDAAHPSVANGRSASPNEKRSLFAPLTTVLKSSPPGSGENDPTVKPVVSKRAKERFAIDESDSEDEHISTSPQTIFHQTNTSMSTPASQTRESRSDSAMEVSSIDEDDTQRDHATMQSTNHTHHELHRDRSIPTQNIHGTPQSDTASTSKPSPSFATHTPSTSRSTPTWSDASLRSYMENDQDIRDLLIIVHDKSNVTPVGLDHPLMGGLFMTERTRLAEMQTQLDSMLTSWIAKKNPGLMAR